MLLAGSGAYLLIVGTFISLQIQTKRQNIAPLWGAPEVAAEIFCSVEESSASVIWVLGASPGACDALLTPITASRVPLGASLGSSALRGAQGDRASFRSGTGYVDFPPALSEVVKRFRQPKDLGEYRRTNQKEGWEQGQEQGARARRTGAARAALRCCRGLSLEVYLVVLMGGFMGASFYLRGSGWDSIALETLCCPRLGVGWRWF